MCWLTTDAKMHVTRLVTKNILFLFTLRQEKNVKLVAFTITIRPRVRAGVEFFNKFQVTEHYGGLVAELTKNSQRRVEMSSAGKLYRFSFYLIRFVWSARAKTPETQGQNLVQKRFLPY